MQHGTTRWRIPKQTPLTQHQLATCARLANLWEQRKAALQLTQDIAAAKLGCTQAAVSHYLKGRTAIGFEAMFRWADLLRVHPYAIDPTFGSRLPASLRLILDATWNADVMIEPSALTYKAAPQPNGLALHDAPALGARHTPCKS